MLFSACRDILSEIWINRARLLRVAWFDVRIETRSFYLGTLWKIFTPLIQLGTFWLVFGIGIRGGAPVDGIPFLVWLMAGFVPWIFVSRAIIQGSMSISNKASMIFKIKYPVSTVPVGAVLICLSDFFIMFLIMVVLYAFHGVWPNIYWFSMLYYTVFMFMLMVALAFITSVIVQLARDFGRLIGSLIQLLFFLTPIMWQETNIPDWARPIFILNPVRYVVTGFRYSLLYRSHFYERPLLIAFFWSMVVCMLILGCFMQKKYSTRFVDWM